MIYMSLNEIDNIKEKVKELKKEENKLGYSEKENLKDLEFLLATIDSKDFQISEIKKQLESLVQWNTLEARRAKNGYIFKWTRTEEDDDEEMVFQSERFKDDYETIRDFLYAILEEIGPCDSKYSEKRIYINIAPGFSNESWDKISCPLCFRGPLHEEQSSD